MNVLQKVRIVMMLAIGVVQVSLAQFSPGELSRAHRQLEGMNNCLQCHETGKEISGKKCLTCHTEIKNALERKRGYHFNVSSQACVACHKEHLGVDAPTTVFDRNTFDHARTGFVRTGKHASIRCEQCHTTKLLQDAGVKELVRKTGRETFLGLGSTCIACHDDRHARSVGTECQTCHSTSVWSPASTFDHAKTNFMLAGKHATVLCSKCHTSLEVKVASKPILFATKDYKDCTPCHTNPHSVNFSQQACRSCHATEGWNVRTSVGKFNHDLTAFKLVGKHAVVACEKCHKSGATRTGSSLKLAHNACTDCHVDYHRGDFLARFNNRCESCHTPFGFVPATFTIAAHRTARFPLNGAHAAVLCEDCHVRGDDGRRVFRYADLRCEACHRDRHGGQFAQEMKGRSCDACHATTDWRPESFDHARTQFPLVGKHASVKCSECHRAKKLGGLEIAQYKGTNMQCQSCHEDRHAGQFVLNGATDCARCHQAVGWKRLTFDHNTHSTFALTGAHARVPCRGCHREERQGSAVFVRFKPLQSTCESCHTSGSFRNG
jgi:hypothetical protein